jgi:cell wall-associated NlpC family hydrolase
VLRRVLLVLALGVGLIAGLSPAADAATRPLGELTYANQDTFRHKLTVSGWAYDPASPSRSMTVKVYADGKYAGHLVTNLSSATLDKQRHISGRHGFSGTVRCLHTARTVTIVPAGSSTRIASRAALHHMPLASTRIIMIAKKYVGHARYREGGSSPSQGFDCSGYTRYVYAHAAVTRRLPHNAEAQRHFRHMRRISARSARAGDLVFYLSGGSAYHVAIYAGHGMQYAAATPKDGIRYQHVWSSAVEYRTITH